MNEEEITKKRNEISTFIKNKWRGLTQEQREDIVSFATEEWLRGRDPRTSYQFIVVDYLRSHEMRVGIRGPSDALAQPNRSAFDTNFDRFLHYGSDKIESGRGFESLIRSCGSLEPHERCIMILRFIWGFNEQEIGNCFSVSASRISQRIGSIQSRIQKALSKDEAKMSEGSSQRTTSLATILSFKGQKMGFGAIKEVAITESFEMEGFNAASF